MAADSPQRRWQAACPNCGAPVEFASAASASAVCSFCRSTLLRDGDVLRKIGIGVFILVAIVLLLRACSNSDDCAQYRDSYGEASAEYAQCKRNSGGGRIYPGGGGSYGGGSYGGYSGGGGGHK